MNINVPELLKGKTKSFRETQDVAVLLKDRKDVLSSGPLSVRIDARGEEGLAVAEGELELDVEVPCARCLTTVREHLVIPFSEAFKVTRESLTEEEEELFTAVTEENVDLQPYVDGAVLLELPFAPLCKEACKGLCAQCGADLNEAECGCSRVKVDPRLAGLKDFFKES